MSIPPPRPPPWFPPLPASIRPKTVGASTRTASPMKRVTLPPRSLAPGSTPFQHRPPGPPPSPPPLKAPPRPPPQSIRTPVPPRKTQPAASSSPTPPPGYRKQVLFGTPYGADRRPSPRRDAPGPQRVAQSTPGSSRAAPYVVTPELRQGRVAPGAYMAHSEYHRPEAMDVPIAPAGPLPVSSGNSFPKVLYVHSIPISVLSPQPPAPRALHLVQPNVNFPLSFQFTGPTVPFVQASRRRQQGVQSRAPPPLPPRPPPRGTPVVAKSRTVVRMQNRAAVAKYEREQIEQKRLLPTTLERKLETLEKRLEREKNALEEKLDKIRALEAEMDGICSDIDTQDKKLEVLEAGGVVEAEEVPEDVAEPATNSENVVEPESASEDVAASEDPEDVADPEQNSEDAVVAEAPEAPEALESDEKEGEEL